MKTSVLTALLALHTAGLTNRCDIGWHYFPKTNKCYLFVENSLPWNDAEHNCQNYFGNIVTISNEDENTFIRNIGQAFGWKQAWVGNPLSEIKDINLDRSKSNYEKRIKGLRHKHRSSNRCLKLDMRSGEWQSDYCFYNLLPYVCEKDVNVEQTVQKGLLNETSEPQKCEFGWAYFEDTDQCYFFGKTSKTWEDANNACRNKASRLLFIESNKETDWVSEAINTSDYSNVWLDRETVNNSNFDGIYDDHKKCANLNLNIKKWQPEDCETIQLAFVCKKPSSAADRDAAIDKKVIEETVKFGQQHDDFSSGVHCQKEWQYSPHSDKCYKLYEKLTTWNAAELSCQVDGAHMVSIHSDAQNRFYAEVASAAGYPRLWIGAAWFLGAEYENNDKSPFNYSKWPKNVRPKFKRSARCLKMTTKNAEWEQHCCRRTKDAYICEKDVKRPY